MFNQVKNYVNKVTNAISYTGTSSSTECKIPNSEITLGRLSSSLQYHRPLFLGLTKDEEKLIGNHKVRQTVVPKNHTVLPFCSGYCEVVNGGKSILNEDCAVAFSVILDTLPKKSHTSNCESLKNLLDPGSDNILNSTSNNVKENLHKNFSLKDSISSLSEIETSSSFPSLNTSDVSQSSLLKDTSSESGDAYIPSSNAKKESKMPSETVDFHSEELNSKVEKVEGDKSVSNKTSSPLTKSISQCKDKTLRLDYFAIFDGHAGEGAALYAMDVLHEILIEKIREVQHLLLVEDQSNPALPDCLLEISSSKPFTTTQFHADSLIIGILQEVMLETDKHLKADQQRFKISGGCTALLVIFILGKMFVAGAGDCRAVLCRSVSHDERTEVEKKVIGMPMSQDFTPATERRRLQYLAFLQPSLLGEHFSRLEFVRRLSSLDVGKKVLYRDYHMTGWAYKEVTSADIRHPMISGLGKSRRLLATIGVTRGLGDHNLLALNQLHDVPIKPFMSSVPEVRVYDLTSSRHGPNDVLVMGSDGLWDVLTSDEVAQRVTSCLDELDRNDSQRYCIAAKKLALAARGDLNNGTWRINASQMASVDDITVFVIPLLEASKKHCQ